ncbi:hypothetical protein L6164_024995 [Bauhinia variegata]|uniref:Uncharacterized protein n=1 Tax=Bauhinia variegata TaxID=167791 RepID=A0ACB9M0N8_BAUVA|nr:hypothetical protein L6164_024995 [Bauhinia variegata]
MNISTRLKQVQLVGVGDLSFLDSSPFAKLLDSCVQSKSAIDTRRIHARIIKTPLTRKFLSKIGSLMLTENVLVWKTHANCLIVCFKGTLSAGTPF